MNRYYLHAVFKLNTISEHAAVGDRIRFYRLKRDMTINMLANKIGVSRYALMDYENNKTELGLGTLYNIALILDITADKLFDEYYNFLAYPYNKKILEIRAALNLSRIQFAKYLSVGNKTVERWENGHNLVSKDMWLILKSLEL